jgi:hypothetical protein
VEVEDVFKVLVLVVYLQCMGILHNLVIDWPLSMQRLMGLAKLLLSPGSSDCVSLDCLRHASASISKWLHMVLALMLLALACALACAAVAWGPRLLRTLLLLAPSTSVATLCGGCSRRSIPHWEALQSPLLLWGYMLPMPAWFLHASVRFFVPIR